MDINLGFRGYRVSSIVDEDGDGILGPVPGGGVFQLRERRLRLDLIRKVDVRLPGKGNSNSHGAMPVCQ